MECPMKSAFLADMAKQYGDDGSKISIQQHRDLIRIYMMGYVTAMHRFSTPDAIEQWKQVYLPTFDANWWPGPDWRWW